MRADLVSADWKAWSRSDLWPRQRHLGTAETKIRKSLSQLVEQPSNTRVAQKSSQKYIVDFKIWKNLKPVRNSHGNIMQNLPLLHLRRPRPIPESTVPTHCGMARLSWPGWLVYKGNGNGYHTLQQSADKAKHRCRTIAYSIVVTLHP